MKHLILLSGAMFLLFAFTGCQKEGMLNPSDNALKSSSKSSSTSQLVLKAKLDKMLASMPAGYASRLQENQRRFLKQHPEYRAFVMNALVPTPCDDNTALNQWLGGELSDWDNTIFFYAVVTGMLDFPTYDALLFENSSANQYFGLQGEHTQALTKSFKDLNRFWNIQSDGIVMAAMHGKMLLDRERVIRIDRILFGDSQADAEFWADLILTLLEVFPQYRNGDHPIFTFNAFALEGFNFPPYGVVPDKIVMGDGIMDAYTGLRV